MAKRIGGFRRKTRNILKKKFNEKGKIKISRFFQEFKVGDTVLLNAEPSYHKGMYNPRFHSKSGKIKAKKGNCYEVTINDYKKEKIVIVHPVHLKRL